MVYYVYQVHKEALRAVELKQGDAKDEIEVLGAYKLQFGAYFGQTFKWLLENDLGYVVYLLADFEAAKESTSSSNLSQNKVALKKYAFNFREVQRDCQLRKEKREREAREKDRAATKTQQHPPQISQQFPHLPQDLHLG